MNTKDKSWKILSLTPIIAVLVILTLVPLVNIFYNSFFDIRWDDGKYNYTYIGLENYIALPNNKFYLPGLINTIKLSIFAVFFQMLFGFLIALGISKINVERVFSYPYFYYQFYFLQL